MIVLQHFLSVLLIIIVLVVGGGDGMAAVDSEKQPSSSSSSSPEGHCDGFPWDAGRDGACYRVSSIPLICSAGCEKYEFKFHGRSLSCDTVRHLQQQQQTKL